MDKEEAQEAIDSAITDLTELRDSMNSIEGEIAELSSNIDSALENLDAIDFEGKTYSVPWIDEPRPRKSRRERLLEKEVAVLRQMLLGGN